MPLDNTLATFSWTPALFRDLAHTVHPASFQSIVCVFDADPDLAANFNKFQKHLLLFTDVPHTVTRALYGWWVYELAGFFLRD